MSEQPEECTASGGRLTARGRATRARIVEAAAKLMLSRGVAATSIPDVLAAAGVSASQLYHYFADKQDLVHAVITHSAQDEQQALGQVSLDSLEALRAWRDAVVALQQERNCAGGCVISLAGEIADVDPEARAQLQATFASWEESIRLGLTAMQERGEIRADADPPRLALSVLAALQGGLLLTQVRRDTTPVEVALDTAIDHIATFAADISGARA
ncbi:TetR/AcrR family transcriptional regulator [Sporichthya brevicatena]|uniref:TetR/AcrR family transcriptional regulator n=1 Tax=Sporichthya brevicatena TaxID=171442 RepID=A0ABN1HBX8_9ACTN